MHAFEACAHALTGLSCPGSRLGGFHVDLAEPAGDQAAYERTVRKVRQIKGLYIHASVHCIVNVGLFPINFFTGSPWWFIWPALGWGIDLGLHALGVHGSEAFFGAGWEERKVRELMEHERQRTG